MKVKEILFDIEDNGGFDNFNNWSKSEVAEWVRANYDCSYATSQKVANLLV